MPLALDWPLPQRIAVGAGTVLLVGGTYFDPQRDTAGLEILVDGRPQTPHAQAMPRLDTLRSSGRSQAYRSGFWGLVELTAGPDPIELALRVTFADGSRETLSLGRIERERLPAALPAPDPAGSDGVVICMATWNPPADLFEIQIESIRQQTHRDWICVISDDASSPPHVEAMRRTLDGDGRFRLDAAPRHLGFLRNFERALALAPRPYPYIALCDQDDRWYPDKLATLIGALGDAALVYSDARVVARDGTLLSPTFWAGRERSTDDLTALLTANAVTGAASLFRRELLDDALPFPPDQFALYHDHWLGLLARVTGGVRFHAAPLYDYVQHRSATLGHAATVRATPLRERARRIADDPRERVRVNRGRYFIDVVRLQALARMLLLRGGTRIAGPHRRVLERFLAAERSPVALAWLGGRALRELTRRTPRTLGAEWELWQALVWRRLLGGLAGRPPASPLRLDALPPVELAPVTARRPPANPGARLIAEKIRPLQLLPDPAVPPRINLLIPSLDLDHFFGGYIAKGNLARRLAERGRRVRIVTVDATPPPPPDWRARLRGFAGLEALPDLVEIVHGRGAALPVSPQDRFVATTWWTAHIAEAARRQLGGPPFLYLIQEYEPMTFPMGSLAAVAAESYRFPHRALFSTELLAEYFRRHEIGVFAAQEGPAGAQWHVFRNAITRVAPPSEAALRARQTRRLLLYARPEPHAARNMFELATLALQHAAADGAFAGGWELRGIGSLGGPRSLELGDGHRLELLPRQPQHAYAELLAEHDVGMALMLTPHPSLVPIEMAAAGLVTVTNTFEHKDAEALSSISANLIAAEPGIESLAAALTTAVRRADDVPARLRGAAIDWPQEWDVALDEASLDRVLALLDGR